MPSMLEGLISLQFFKVTIFFVLGGFVVTHSLRKVPPAATSLTNYIFRRQVRLDFPYWVTLVLTVIVIYFPPYGERYYDPPSWRAIVVNFVYLQNILHAWAIVGVAWTLCLQVQFYLFFVLLIGLQGFVNRVKIDLEKRWNSMAWVLLITGLLFPVLITNDHGGWFLFWWSYFAIGCLSYLAVQNLTSPWSVIALGIGMMGHDIMRVLILGPAPPTTLQDWCNQLKSFFLAGPMIALLLLEAGRRQGLERWGNQKILLFLSRISYSLYLTHLQVMGLFYGLFAAQQKSPFIQSVVWLTGIGIAIIFACVMHHFVEKPAITLARKLKNFAT